MSPKNATEMIGQVTPKLLMFINGDLRPLEFIENSTDPSVAEQFKLLQENEGLVQDLYDILVTHDAVDFLGFTLGGQEARYTLETSGKHGRHHTIYQRMQETDSSSPDCPVNSNGNVTNPDGCKAPEGNSRPITPFFDCNHCGEHQQCYSHKGRKPTTRRRGFWCSHTHTVCEGHQVCECHTVCHS